MPPDRIAAAREYLRLEEVPGCFRALDLFVRCGAMEPAEAEEWRIAVLSRAAALTEPVAEA